MEKYNILIVDDDALILKTLEKYFDTKENINVFIENNPLNVYDKVKNNNIHIVLLDIQMPEKNGLVLLKEIKEINPMIQIIIMSGYASPERVLIAFKEGANDFVLKPFPTLEHIWEIITITIKKIERWRESLGLSLKNIFVDI